METKSKNAAKAETGRPEALTANIQAKRESKSETRSELAERGSSAAPEALTVKKSENFAEWYNQLVKVAGLVDQRYPVKGCEVMMPLGTAVLRNMSNMLEDLLKQNGNSEVLFPLFIPENFLAKEAEHIKGFGNEVYYVTHAGENKLEERLILRPTSETAMYPMFALWIRSHNDLPLKVFQTVSVFRYETKMTKPLVRMREVMFFNESHTAHESWDAAEREVEAAIKIYSKHYRENLALPFIVIKRLDADKFPGAVYTLAFDTIMPDGKRLQIGTAHNLGENFSKPFNIQFLDKDQTKKYVNQTCYGISTRPLAAITAVHGDDRGLVLPPKIAPTQIVIVPILFEKTREAVIEHARRLLEKLVQSGWRVHLDERDISAGAKFYDWELRGVPIRIELGPRDIERKTVVVARRDTGEKVNEIEGKIVTRITSMLADIQASMLKRAEDYHTSMIVNAKSVKDIATAVGKGMFARAMWCGEMKCAENIEKGADAAISGTDIAEKAAGKCICGNTAKHVIYVGKSY